MADEAENQSSDAPAKKGLPIKLIGIVAGIMLLEAGVVVAFMKFTAGPSQAEAMELQGQQLADLEAFTEIKLLGGRFQNLSTGRVWDWEVEIFLKVRQKHNEHVAAVLERRQAEIQSGIAMIYRKAQHSQLKEPGLQSIGRKLNAFMNNMLGEDPDGEPYYEELLVTQNDGYPSDF